MAVSVGVCPGGNKALGTGLVDRRGEAFLRGPAVAKNTQALKAEYGTSFEVGETSVSVLRLCAVQASLWGVWGSTCDK